MSVIHSFSFFHVVICIFNLEIINKIIRILKYSGENKLFDASKHKTIKQIIAFAITE